MSKLSELSLLDIAMIATINAIILKVAGITNASWTVVLSPAWVWLGFVIAVAIAAILIAVLADILSTLKYKWQNRKR